MGRRQRIEPRHVVFIGVEGKSERAFVRFLQDCCDGKRLHVHLRVHLGEGGDSFAVVDGTCRALKRLPEGTKLDKKLVMLDHDRVEADLRAGRDAQARARQAGLTIVLQKPDLEGMLVRLHPGMERRELTKQAAKQHLKALWPDYRKPPPRVKLNERFGLADLQRLARFDNGIGSLLEILGL